MDRVSSGLPLWRTVVAVAVGWTDAVVFGRGGARGTDSAPPLLGTVRVRISVAVPDIVLQIKRARPSADLTPSTVTDQITVVLQHSRRWNYGVY